MPTPEEMKLDTKELLNVEIFAEGNWNGHEFKDKDLEEMEKNFKDRVAPIYVTIDHDKEMTKETKKTLGAASLGWVSHLWRQGGKLLANIKQVPKVIAELFEAGALGKKSIELWFDYNANGKKYHNVIEGITFTGRIPAVNTLADMVTLYKQESQSGSQEGTPISLTYEKENSMDITVKKEEYDALKSDSLELATFKKNADNQKAEFEKLNSKLEDATAKLEAVTEERDTLVAFKKEADEKAKKDRESSAEEFVKKMIDAGKLLAKYSEFTKKQILALEGEDLKTFKAEIEDRPESLFTQDLGAGTGAASEKISSEDDTEVLDKKIMAQMKKDGLENTPENYAKVAQKLGVFEADDADKE